MNYEEFEAAERPRERQLVTFTTAWALDAAALIDSFAPGFVVHLFRSKPVLLNAILSALAHPRLLLRLETRNLDVGSMRSLGDRLMTLKPRELVETAWGSCPDGLLGCFSRIKEPLEAEDYGALFAVLADPAEKRRQQALRYWPRLTSDRLRGILALDDALLTNRLCGKLRTEEQALMANDVLAVIREHRPDMTDEAIREFASQTDPLTPFQEQLDRFLSLVEELSPLGVELPDDFLHLRTRSDFRVYGSHYRNCLATKFDTEALTGRAAFLIYRRRPAIAVLMAVNSGWLLGKIHAPGNEAPPLDLVEEVRALLGAAGIPFVVPAPVVGPLATVRRLLMRHDPFGLGPDEFEEWVPELS